MGTNGKPETKNKEAVNCLRVFPRVRVEGQVIIHDEDHLFIAPLNNISAGGIFVDKLLSLEHGAQVRVVVKSPKLGCPVQAKGTVVRVQREGAQGLAVEFTSITRSAKEAIQNCVFESKLEMALKVA